MENNIQLDIDGREKITLVQKIAYGTGDTACNIVWAILGGVLFYFYTDYVNVSPAILGTVMFLSRLFDGFSDFVMGFLIERTNSKYGKARPWLLWMAAPFAICAFSLFLIPADASQLVKGIYIFITYNLVTTVCYTAINLPYGALSAMMTRDQSERTSLAVFRQGIAPFGRLLVVTFTLPIIKALGNDQAAWIKVMFVWCVVAFGLIIFNFLKCEERVVVKKAKEEKIPIVKSVKALFMNKYWIFTTALWGLTAVHHAIVGTYLPYYCKYVFNNEALYGPLYGIETGLLILVAFSCPTLLKRFTKRDLSLIGCVIAIASQLVLLIDPTSVPLMFVSMIGRAIGISPLMTLVFAMLADSVEYGDWKTNIRQEGMIFSASGIGSKAGGGITTAVLGAILTATGYITSTGANVVQPQSAIDAITNTYIYGITGVWVIMAIVLVFYKLDIIYPKIMKELEERELCNNTR